MKQTLLVICIALAACSTLVPDTMRAVADIDPLRADPADIALKLTLPPSVGIVPGSAMLRFGARNQTGASLEQSFALEEKDGVFAVSNKDHAELRRLQSEVGKWKAEDPTGTKGSISLGFGPCRIGDTVPEDARASVGIRLDQGGTFLPLVQEGPLRVLLKEVSPNGMDPC